MSFLDSIETGNLVVSHSVVLLGDRWNSLNKSNHGLIALRIEFVIVTSFNLLKFIKGFSLWGLGNIWLNCILEIS